MGNTSCCAAHSSPPPQRRLPTQGQSSRTNTSIISSATSRITENINPPRIPTTPQEFHNDVEELYQNLEFASFTSSKISNAKKRINTLESAYSNIEKNENGDLLENARSTLNKLSVTVDEVIHILELENSMNGEELITPEFSDAIGHQLSKLKEQLQDPNITEDHRQKIGEWIRDIKAIAKRKWI